MSLIKFKRTSFIQWIKKVVKTYYAKNCDIHKNAVIKMPFLIYIVTTSINKKKCVVQHSKVAYADFSKESLFKI